MKVTIMDAVSFGMSAQPVRLVPVCIRSCRTCGSLPTLMWKSASHALGDCDLLVLSSLYQWQHLAHECMQDGENIVRLILMDPIAPQWGCH